MVGEWLADGLDNRRWCGVRPVRELDRESGGALLSTEPSHSYSGALYVQWCLICQIAFSVMFHFASDSMTPG